MDSRSSLEFNQAIPPTEILNSEAQKGKAGLARQGSLAERQLPSTVALAKRQSQSLNTTRTSEGGAATEEEQEEEEEEGHSSAESVSISRPNHARVLSRSLEFEVYLISPCFNYGQSWLLRIFCC